MNREDNNWYNPCEEIATITWCMADLKAAFEKKNIAFTEENIDKILDNRFATTLEERSIEIGWDIIDHIIDESHL